MPSQEITPLPKLKLLVLSLILFCNSFINSILLPFIAFMVAGTFKPTTDFGFPNEIVGRYSGLLLSSFMLGPVLFSYAWGKASDRFGRRPILILGLFLTSISCLAFGFSVNYKMAILLRFVTGSVNSIMAVAKTYLAEITDQTNQSQGFSILGFNKALGLIIGPVVGGFLAQPSMFVSCSPLRKYPHLFPQGTFFDRHPYALPTIIAFALSMIGTILAYLVLEETLESHPCLLDSECPLNEPLLPKENSVVPSTLWQILADKPTLSVISIYFIVQIYHQAIYDEAFVLWARLPISMGGLNWTSSQIGVAFSIGGITLLMYQSMIFPVIERKLGPLNAFRMGVLMNIPAYIVLPRIARLLEASVDSRDFNDKTWIVWVLVFMCTALRSVSSLQSCTACFIMIANGFPFFNLVSQRANRGKINGLSQSLGSFAQLLGPIIGGSLFTLSLTNQLGVSFVFNVMIGFATVASLVSLLVPVTVNKRREDK